ncbi:Aste57867_18380 [Aphanomyces stellatus]|uniref:Aste57867_18380 protein n=1 Tax=Aphanomyces stellatus TaxID=120398 RepID=A0A485L9Y3_9STRA|nr:hypothetical protein As57867_018318 [Aphanomyces stellatus]VFT95116.1 Aste57867_18380 [Aphanomyces stellatus]
METENIKMGAANSKVNKRPDANASPVDAHRGRVKVSTMISDKIRNFWLDELQQALRQAGLESSNLVLAIDYTLSNKSTGERTFGGKCLHTIDPNVVNPYQSVIHILGQTLEVFDDDKLIPALAFGDIKSGSSGCYLLGGTPCQGFAQVLLRRADAVHSNVERTREYHILVIVADGHVNVEHETREAIVEASTVDARCAIAHRRFDNFQFVDFNKVLRLNPRHPDVGFATVALMEVPDQFKAIRELGLL